eukprot:TRINITY_DN393_c0_g3_i1.p1 TRINITY_DN393_c0_g3~~TRINITY_DN393_c0_g3_i1.p1  ORF type:complete len:258 (+),score=85.37 TRINITY_DN393_c0_g3_i1:36-809(+)
MKSGGRGGRSRGGGGGRGRVAPYEKKGGGGGGGGGGRGRGKDVKFFQNMVPFHDSEVAKRLYEENNQDIGKAHKALVEFDKVDFLARHPEFNNDIQVSFKFIEIEGDLFSCPETTALAHCVSEDLSMSKGIAIEFKNRFGQVTHLSSQNVKSGGVAWLNTSQNSNKDEKREEKGDVGRDVYYLVTKKKYWNKPRYEELWTSMVKMNKLVEQHQVTSLAMPKIGCGLDGLQWDLVKKMILNALAQNKTLKDVTIYIWK